MIAQTIICICGIAVVWLTQCATDRQRRWACIFGLAAEPCWMYATIKAQQWGMLVLACVYIVGWLRGFRHYWIRPRVAS